MSNFKVFSVVLMAGMLVFGYGCSDEERISNEACPPGCLSSTSGGKFCKSNMYNVYPECDVRTQ